MPITDIKEVFGRMAEPFNASAVQGMDAVFQFNITGQDGGKWHVVVKDGACQVSEGSHDEASGDIMLAQRIQQLFEF